MAGNVKAAVGTGMRKNPVEFVREVQREVSKVTWPSRRETFVTTAVVFVMVIIAAMFFLLVDQVLYMIISFVEGIRS